MKKEVTIQAKTVEEAVFEGAAQLGTDKDGVIYEVIEAVVRMNSAVPHLHLWSIDPDGAYTGEVPNVLKDGQREFRIGNVFPSIYYLLTV